METLKKSSIPQSIVRLWAKNPSELDAAFMDVNDVIVQMTSTQNIKVLGRIPVNKINELVDLVSNAEVVGENAFLRPRIPAATDKEWNDLKIYDERKVLHAHYSLIREDIANHVLNNVDISKDNLFILDLGTGKGDCLDKTVTVVQSEDKKIQAIGTDKNKINIIEARRIYENKPYQFEVEDSINLTKIIEKYKKDKDSFVIITSSGSLTRLVLNNTLDVLNILQQAYRLADMVVIGGETEILVTQRLAKKNGLAL